MVRAQWGAGSARGWDPTGGGVSSGRARTAAGKILATGAGAVAIRLEKLQRYILKVTWVIDPHVIIVGSYFIAVKKETSC